MVPLPDTVTIFKSVFKVIFAEVSLRSLVELPLQSNSTVLPKSYDLSFNCVALNEQTVFTESAILSSFKNLNL